MYEREDAQGIIKLAEAGVLKLRKSARHNVIGQFSFEWEKAIETASDLFGPAPIWSGRLAPLCIGCGSGDFAAGVAWI